MDLFLTPEKCECKEEGDEFLGMIIGGRGEFKHGYHPPKVEALVVAMPEATEGYPRMFGTSQFLPAVYSRFLKNAYPLNNLTCKETVWRWGGWGGPQKWVDELKRRFVAGDLFGSQPTTNALKRESDASDCNRSCISDDM